ncbi:MAG TPA: S46 family peptidase, partial [Bacteroidota bacterium]
MNRNLLKYCSAVVFGFSLFIGGCSTQPSIKPDASQSYINFDTVKAGPFDTGKMWTFDVPPSDYFAQTYHFNPPKEWFEKARLSAVRIPGCTASFVSEDGLIMSNHHCARGALDKVNKEGEKLAELGFYAATLEEERKSPVTYVDQLILMDDVTIEVQKAFDSGTTDDDKVAKRSAKFTEIQQRYAAKFKETSQDSMVFNVIPFYNGGKYSVYGYKRYTDVRLVFAPEEAAAFFGGDPDNFTYPRYDFDCSFFRVYEN